MNTPLPHCPKPPFDALLIKQGTTSRAKESSDSSADKAVAFVRALADLCAELFLAGRLPGSCAAREHVIKQEESPSRRKD